MLAVVTHRFAVHFFVILVAVTIVFINFTRASEVRAEDFADGSLLEKVFKPNNETTITAETISPTSVRYIDTSATVRFTPDIVADLYPSENIIVSDGSGAFVQPNVIGGTDNTRTKIETYTVKEGDTASMIAAKFGVTTATVLWSNDLSDASLIKPGDQLWILPTSGIAHTVKSGETLAGIADKYDAEPDEILEFNKLITADDLIAGTEVMIPGGTQPPPPPPPPPPPAATTRLASVRSVFTSSTPPANAPVASSGSFSWPTNTHRISQNYGWGHSGLDIDGEFGDPIWAAEGGYVEAAGWYGGYGIQVVINHGNGIRTRYGHLQKLFVSAGQSVSRGQTLGEEGSTGHSTGSHLHYEVIVNGATVNPYNYH